MRRGCHFKKSLFASRIIQRRQKQLTLKKTTLWYLPKDGLHLSQKKTTLDNLFYQCITNTTVFFLHRFISECFTGWWFQPNWKILYSQNDSKWESSPNRGKNKTWLKPTPRECFIPHFRSHPFCLLNQLMAAGGNWSFPHRGGSPKFLRECPSDQVFLPLEKSRKRNEKRRSPAGKDHLISKNKSDFGWFSAQRTTQDSQHATPSIHALQFAERQWLPGPPCVIFWRMIWVGKTVETRQVNNGELIVVCFNQLQ